jgi:hypothetical protein
VGDRQFLASLAISGVAAAAALAGIVALPLWLGWAGLAGLGLTAGGFLGWFYWGPRPDLTPRGRVDDLDGLDHD